MRKLLALRFWKTLFARASSPTTPATTWLQWLSDRGVPDSAITVLLGSLAALTLIPYIGGRTISFGGGSPVTIPRADESWVWFLVFTAPLCWVALIAKVVNAPIGRTLITAVIAAVFATTVLYGIKRVPAIVLSALSPNYDQLYHFEFLSYQHTWDMGHRKTPSESYSHFRTAPRNLVGTDGKPIGRGCALRVDRIEIEANGYTDLHGQDAFDLEVFGGGDPLLEGVQEFVPADHWLDVIKSPSRTDISADVVVGVTGDIVNHPQYVHYMAKYDFERHSADAKPMRIWTKQIASNDIEVTNLPPKFQVSGWTLSGGESYIQLQAIAVRVLGRLDCGFWF